MKYYPEDENMMYYPTYDCRVARALRNFEVIGTAKHLQGEGHRFVFLKNKETGECAIKVEHPRDSQVFIYDNAEHANNAYLHRFAVSRER